MKKQIVIGTAAIILAAIGTGCAGIYNLFGTTPEAVHNAAVEKVSEYAEAAINRKIEKSENLSGQGFLLSVWQPRLSTGLSLPRKDFRIFRSSG